MGWDGLVLWLMIRARATVGFTFQKTTDYYQYYITYTYLHYSPSNNVVFSFVFRLTDRAEHAFCTVVFSFLMFLFGNNYDVSSMEYMCSNILQISESIFIK